MIWFCVVRANREEQQKRWNVRKEQITLLYIYGGEEMTDGLFIKEIISSFSHSFLLVFERTVLWYLHI